jgi:RNA polymerase sigma-70 factor (ECF subfamily)
VIVVAEPLDRPLGEDEDHELVERSLIGDRAAFDALVRKYQRSIFWLALRYVKNEADAQDVAQRAFVQAFHRISGFRRRSSFKTWVYRIAINLALNALRDRSRQKLEPLKDEFEAEVSDPVLAKEEQRRLRAAIQTLPPKQRTVVELRAFEELSFKEIGEIVQSSEDSAKVNYHHALKRLRVLIQEGENQ